MNVTYAIEGYLNHIKDDLLADFSDVMLDGFVYDESIDFNSRASSFIRKQPEFQKLENSTIPDWAFIVWNRGDLSVSKTSRPMKITVATNNDGIINGTSTVKMAGLDVQIKVFTNNVEIGERIEEYFHILSGELSHYIADYKALGEMKCSVDPETNTSFEKEELAEVGSTIGIGLTAVIHFPIFLPTVEAKRIEFIHSKIWDGYDQYDTNAVILVDEWIPEEPI